MLTSVFATKLGMTQAWTQAGKRLPVTKCKAELQRIVTVRDEQIRDISTRTPQLITVKQVVIGYGNRALKRLTKPLQGVLTKQGFSDGVKRLTTVRLSPDADATTIQPGATISLSTELAVGDVVQVQGTSKGRGYGGVVKRHGFHGGPATHGQSDRERAPGSIGQGTTPGRVYKNHRMAGHFGVASKTVTGLVVLRVDDTTGEIWLSGPVPGSVSSLLKITKMGTKKDIQLHGDNLPNTAEVELEESQLTEPESTPIEPEAAVDSKPDVEPSVDKELDSEPAPAITDEVKS